MRSRRILAMLLALSMIFGLLTTTALADNEVDQNTSNVEENAANGTSEGGSGEGQSSGASEDESSKVTNKEDVTTGEETIPEEKKTTSSEEVDTQVGEGENSVTGTSNLVVVNGGTGYDTLEAAMAEAKPVDGTITYTINGKAEVSATGWVQVAKAGLADLETVEFVGVTADAEISITGGLAILADQGCATRTHRRIQLHTRTARSRTALATTSMERPCTITARLRMRRPVCITCGFTAVMSN